MFTLIVIGFLIYMAVKLEVKIVNAIPALKKLLIRYPLLAIGFSFVLSIAIGGVFSAGGLICMVAGVGSTIVVQPWYNGNLDGVNTAYRAKRERLRGEKDLWMRRGSQVLSFLRITWLICSAPLRALLWLMDRRASRTI